MKKIFIHAGPGKTGTSTIQYWLSRNVDLLAENGIHYPYHDVDNNGVSPGNYDAVLSQGENNKWVADTDKIESLLHYFNASECHTLLLSSEIFMGQIENLLLLMPNAEVILYFRNPLEVMESNYNQLVKRHRHTANIMPNKRSVMLAINRFTELIKKFGKIKIIVKPYLNGIDKSFNITQDLLSTINCSLKASDCSSIINRSYPSDLLEFKRLLNHYPIEKFDHNCDLILQKISKDRPDQFSLSFYLSEEIKKNLITEIEEFISKHNLYDLQPILDDVMKDNLPYNEKKALEEDQIMKIFSAIENEKKSLLHQILTTIDGNYTKHMNRNICASKLIEKIKN